MYQILSSYTAQALSLEVNEFLQKNREYEFLGGPYSDGTFHYQALINKVIRQLND